MFGLGLDYGLGFSSDIRLRQDPQLRVETTATAVNKQLNFTVKNKPHTTNYIHCIFYD